MIRTRRAVACGAALLAAGVTAPLAAAPAQADGREWRVFDARPQPGWDELQAVAVSSRRNAWVFGGGIGDTPPLRPIAGRWSGGAWHDVALPDGVVGSIDTADTTSARNVWAVADFGDSGPSTALHWDGNAWTVSRTWKRLTTDVITTGRRNAWVFGSSRAGDGAGTWHFNGKRWRRVDLGDLLLERGSAVSARDIWAVGTRRPALCGDRTVAHYDGESWREIPTGDALPPDIPQPDEGGPSQCVYLRDILATSSESVWVVGHVYRSDGNEQTGTEPVLAHYDGRTWRREHIPDGWQPDRLASDGRGGLWVIGDPHWDSPRPDTTTLMHRTAGGTWRTAAIDAGDRDVRINELALVPGTRNLWGVGQLQTSEEPDGAVYRYR